MFHHFPMISHDFPMVFPHLKHLQPRHLRFAEHLQAQAFAGAKQDRRVPHRHVHGRWPSAARGRDLGAPKFVAPKFR